jgi:predicted RNase H-like HicB family nuclease
VTHYPIEIDDEDQTTNVVIIDVTPEAERLAARPYHVEITREDGDYVARIPELPGLVTGGATLEEMYAMVEDAKRGWIATALHYGDPVPEPQGALVRQQSASQIV